MEEKTSHRKTEPDGQARIYPRHVYVVLEIEEPFEVLDAALAEAIGRCEGTGRSRRHEPTSGSVRYRLGREGELGSIVLRKSARGTSLMRIEEVAVASWDYWQSQIEDLTEESAARYLDQLETALFSQADILRCLFNKLDRDPACVGDVDRDKLRDALNELRARSIPPWLREGLGIHLGRSGPYVSKYLHRDAETIHDWDQPFPISETEFSAADAETIRDGDQPSPASAVKISAPEGTGTGDDPRPPRGPNVGTIEKVAKAWLLWREQEKLQTAACDLAGTSPNTLRKWKDDPRTEEEIRRLKTDEDYPDNLYH